MEKRSLLTKILRYLSISPYTWYKTLSLPYYFLFPSEKNHCHLPRQPIQFANIPDDKKSIKFIFAGDILPLNHHHSLTLSDELIKLISGADYFAANCEAPIINEPLDSSNYSFMTFTMPFTYLENIFSQLFIKRKNCILSMANNHSRDVTESVFNSGIKLARDKLNLTIIGQHSPHDPSVKILHAKNGLNVGITSWTHLMNGEKYLDHRKIVNRHLDIRQIDWINFKKNNHIDFLIGMPHWDQEYHHFPQEETFQLAKKFITQGFDLLIGSHSHVLQPLTWFNNKLCCFSLGNFCSTDRHWRTQLIPIFEVSLSSSGNIAAYQLHIYAQVDYKTHICIEPLQRTSLKFQNQVEHLLRQLFL